MSHVLKTYRFQKCSDVDRDYPLFEVVTDEGRVVMDLSVNDDSGEMEVFFHDQISKHTISMQLLMAILEDGRTMLKSEM